MGDSTKSTPYRLTPEISWNYGINLTKEFTLGKRDGLVYRTDFVNQVVVDFDQSPQTVVFL